MQVISLGAGRPHRAESLRPDSPAAVCVRPRLQIPADCELTSAPSRRGQTDKQNGLTNKFKTGNISICSCDTVHFSCMKLSYLDWNMISVSVLMHKAVKPSCRCFIGQNCSLIGCWDKPTLHLVWITSSVTLYLTLHYDTDTCCNMKCFKYRMQPLTDQITERVNSCALKRLWELTNFQHLLQKIRSPGRKTSFR